MADTKSEERPIKWSRYDTGDSLNVIYLSEYIPDLPSEIEYLSGSKTVWVRGKPYRFTVVDVESFETNWSDIPWDEMQDKLEDAQSGCKPPSRTCTYIKVEEMSPEKYAMELVSLVYAKEDEHIAQSLMGELRKNAGALALLDIDPEGFILFICTKNSIDNHRIIEKLEQAKTEGATIITFVFDVTIPSSLLSLLQSDSVLNRKYQAEAYNAMARLQEKLNYSGNYHSEEAVRVGVGGAMDDYVEYYRFPCCDRTVIVGDGPISRFRADGCCKKETGAE